MVAALPRCVLRGEMRFATEEYSMFRAALCIGVLISTLLLSTANSPAPTNLGVANTVHGPRTTQCAAL